MKINRHGRAKILTQEELQRLFASGFTEQPERERALFGVCLFTACRINEAVTLEVGDLYNRNKKLREIILFRKSNTKGQLKTREIPIIQELRDYLKYYQVPFFEKYLFPGLKSGSHLHPDTAYRILKRACERVDIEGVSTHSFRRTTLSALSRQGIPLRVIQEISGHCSLDELYKYLEVDEALVKGAIAHLSLIAPLTEVYKTSYRPRGTGCEFEFEGSGEAIGK